MKYFTGVYSYAEEKKEPEVLKKRKNVSADKLTLYYEGDDVIIIKNDAGGLCAAKGFFYDDGVNERNINSSNGNFISAIYDAKEEKLVLFREIFGAVPLYFCDDGKTLVFSSHIENLKGFLGKQINAKALDGYFTHKAVMPEETVYKGIYALKAGYVAIKKSAGPIEFERFEKTEFKENKAISRKDAVSEIKKLLASSLDTILKKHSETAVFLSGGLDSNITASLAVKKGVDTVFSAKIDNEDFDESEYAKKAAKFYGMKYNEIRVGGFSYDDLFELAQTYEQPFADASAYPVHKLMKSASRHYKSFLTGDGADELFGGYLRYRAVKAAALVPGIIKKPLRLLGNAAGSGKSDRSILRYAQRFSSALSSSVCDVNAAWYAAFQDEEKRLLFSGTQKELKALDGYKAYCEGASLGGIFNADISTQLADCFSLKIFFPAEKLAISVSSPFYNKRIFKFSEELPEKYKLSLFNGKILLKQAFSKDLPDFVAKRRKRGFGIPLNAWFRGECRELARELLLSERSHARNYFNGDAVKTVFDDHISLKHNNGQKIWLLCMFEMWNRAFVDGKK